MDVLALEKTHGLLSDIWVETKDILIARTPYTRAEAFDPPKERLTPTLSLRRPEERAHNPERRSSDWVPSNS